MGYLKADISPIFEMLGLTKTPAEKAKEDEELRRQQLAGAGAAIQRAFPRSPGAKPEVSWPLLQAGATPGQILDLAQKLSPEEPDKLTQIAADAAIRLAQNDPTMTDFDKRLAQGYLAKKYGYEAPGAGTEMPSSLNAAAIQAAYEKAKAEGRPVQWKDILDAVSELGKAQKSGSPREYNTADELALGMTFGDVDPATYAKGVDNLVTLRRKLAQAGATGGDETRNLTPNQALDQASEIAIARAREVTQDRASYEPVLSEQQYEELLKTNPQEAGRYFRIKDSDQYTAYTPDAKTAIDEANSILTDPTRKQALADTILAARTPGPGLGNGLAIPEMNPDSVAHPEWFLPADSADIPPEAAIPANRAGAAPAEPTIEQMLKELQEAGFQISADELRDPANIQILKTEYQRWVSQGRPKRNAPK